MSRSQWGRQPAGQTQSSREREYVGSVENSWWAEVVTLFESTKTEAGSSRWAEDEDYASKTKN